jgi:Tol biopolymer transport system component
MRIARSALLLALAAAALACEPAGATFPGRNGDIVLTSGIGGRYVNQQISLFRFAPRFGLPSEAPVCAEFTENHALDCQLVGRGAFTPDGTRIAVTVIQGTTSLWTLTSNGQRIDRVPLTTDYWDVRWAPDESALLALRYLDPGAPLDPSHSGPAAVSVLNKDGSERSLLASDVTGADWCADGRVVVAQHGQIWVIDATRPGASRRLTHKGGADPSCSPGSRQVAFTRRGAIWTVPTSGGRARRVTLGYGPVWSPDGKQIAYLRERRGRYDLETNLYRVGLRRLIVRRVSHDYLMSDDPYSDQWVQDPDWQPRPATAGESRWRRQ